MVALGKHPQDFVEALALQPGVGFGADHQAIEVVLAPLLAGHFGDDLLRQHVQRLAWQHQAVQLATAHAVEQRRAFHQVVAGGREQPALGGAADTVPGTPDPLQEGGDGARRRQLADQLDVADIDAQLQRGGRHQYLQLPGLEALLGIQAQLLGQAAVVGRHLAAAEAFGEEAGDPLGHAPGVDEHQGGAVLAGQVRQAVVDQLPGVVGHHRFQRHRRYLDAQVAGARIADVDDPAGRIARIAAGADEEARDLLDRFLRGGQPDPQQRSRTQRLQALQRQRQVAAALAAGQGMDLVDDHAAHPGKHLPARLRAEQDVQRFGRGDQDVRRALAHRSAFDLRRIAGAHRATDIDVGQAETRQFLADASQRLLQVDADVVGQRFQRRDIDHLGSIRQLAAGGQPLHHQGIDGGEEGGQGLARTGGRGDQGRKPLADRRPGLDLGRRGRGEVAFEPLADGGMELRQGPRSRLGAAGGRG